MFVYLTYIPILLILLVLFFLFIRKKGKTDTKVFSFVILSLAFWVFTLIFADSGKNEFSVLWWTRLALVGPIFAIYFLVIFSYLFPKVKESFSKLKAVLFAIPPVIILPFVFTKYNIESVTIESWGSNPEAGILYQVLLVYLIIYLFFSLRNFYLSYKEYEGIYRFQIVYLFLGIVLFLTIAIITNLFSVIFDFAQASIFGPASSLFFIGCVAYTVFRYRLMDIRIVIRKGLVYFGAIIVIVVVAGLLMYVNSYFNFPISAMVLGIILMIGALIAYDPLKNLFFKTANKYFFTSLYNYQRTLKNLTTELTTIIDIDKIFSLIIDSISIAMGIETACVLLTKEEGKNRFTYRVQVNKNFNKSEIDKLKKGNFIAKYLKKYKRILVVNELHREKDLNNDKTTVLSNLEKMEKQLKDLRISICLPLLAKGELIGIIILGNKASKDAFTVEDLDLLETMTHQASVAMENAQLYEEVQDLNKNLEKKVDEATKEIQEKNVHLNELLEMKSEFLTVASHQLRTPTSVVRGMLSMLDEEGSSMSKKDRENFIAQAYMASNNLEHIVHDLLSATELEGGKIQYNIEPYDILPEVEDVIKERQWMADEKKLKLKLDKPKKKLAPIMADKIKLHELIGNMVDNGIHYTPKGTVTVGFNTEPGKITIWVKDTGIGLDEQQKEEVFKRFVRGKDALHINPNGTGLGLYIVKKVVESMNGEVAVESPGKGKGSTFSLTLPALLE
ncbi:GAF domain-containing protein [Patescibacteria group bacterium]|nr:GAF domain-containing protein [Patescibacteria group bacterium]MBU1673958.1 GAF domain-containing protein [Patescibacteria group bacterium]MBU1963952.1 GAF domain-containing protein [Patescibacteria group bacterium]